MEMDRKGGIPRSQEPVAPNGTTTPDVDLAKDLAGATIASTLTTIFGDGIEPNTLTTETFAARNVGEFRIGPDTTMVVERVKEPLTVAA